MTKQVLFLMSDTGGGHRAAAEAIREALYMRYGHSAVNVSLIDVFKQTAFPLNYMPELYPWLISHSKSSWGLGYHLSNTRRRADMLSGTMYLTNGHLLRRMVRQNQADVVVCVHSVVSRPSLTAMMTLDQRPPFMTVVTDLVSTHMFWYDKRVERCLVPTQAAFDRGLESGMRPSQMRVTGLPVHPHFTKRLEAKQTARAELGWHPDLPTLLIVGGGEGMGPLYETARALNDRNMQCQIAVITGRNAALKNRLEAADWNQPTHVYGFVKDMPRLMSAADILVTKAGPATICEASIAGLPMILYDAIPGQETGNVEHVIQHRAGAYAPEPEAVARTAKQWLSEGFTGLQRRSEAASRISRPNAVWDIAEEVWELAHRPPINNNRRTLFNDLLDAPREIFPTLS